MALFFDIKTDDDKKLMQGYDTAVAEFRREVAQAMTDIANETPAAKAALLASAEAIRLRPLPSEVNDSPAALRRLALSGLVSENVFSGLFLGADTRGAAAKLAARMREIGKTTTGLPQFAPLTQAVIAVTAAEKLEITEFMGGAGYQDYLNLLRAAQPKAAEKAPKGPKP